MEEELMMQFRAVQIGKETYAIVEKEKFVIEELEKTWVIRIKQL